EVRGPTALCDCDGDGMTEIVLADWDGSLNVWDYNFAFSPAGPPAWPQFHHDAMRTGYFNGVNLVDVAPKPGEAPAAIEFAAPYPNPTRAGARIAYGIPASHAGED